MAARKPAAQKSSEKWPVNVDAERFVIGSVLLDDSMFRDASQLKPEFFSTVRHQKIWKRITEIKDRDETVDRVTLANELSRYDELESVGGLSYLVTLDDSLPQIPNIDSYIKILREKHTLRKIMLVGQKAMAAAQLENASSLSIIRSMGKVILQLELAAGKKSGFLNPGQILESHGGVQDFVMSAIKPGISWGYPQFDEHLLGLQEGCQYLIGARTGMGKSAMAMNIAASLARRGEVVTVLSLEMSKEILITRLIASESGVPIKAIIKKDLLPDQRRSMMEAAERISSWPLHIDDTSGLSLSEACAKIDEGVVKFKSRVFIVDHLHKLRWQNDTDARFKDEYTAFTAASGAFSDRARRHSNSSIILVQLSRPADKRKPDAKPTLNDIRNTGALEQDATGVVFIHRPEYFKRGDHNLRGVAEVGIAKSRNGSSGEVVLNFRSVTTTFTDEGKKPELL